MSAPQVMDAQHERANEAISRAIGDELRRTREAQGWSRARFVELLPFRLGDRTLLAYEHGLRQITALRLIELCQGLGTDAPSLLARALQRARIHINALPLTVDLQALLRDRNANFRPIVQWARNALNERPDGVAEVAPDVVRNLALFMGFDHQRLANYLAQFLPEESDADGEPQ